MDWFDPEILWPLGGSIAAGALIGLERQYHGAPAGFRTHILVSLTSGLLMLAAVHQVRWLSDTPRELIRIDPVRMAHGILTGIGFLGAGVIFREGLTIRGLTTAASLWITSALGTLYGIGFYGLAIIGTVTTLVVLAAVGLTEALLPQRSYVDVTVKYGRAAQITEADFRSALTLVGLTPTAVSCSLEEDVVAFEATCRTGRRPYAPTLASSLIQDPNVRGLKICPHQ